MEIRRLRNYTQAQFDELAGLMTQLSAKCEFDEVKLMAMLREPNCRLYVMEEKGRIIGCASLCIFYSPTGRKGSIEDVVVSEEYRGQQLGRRLMEHVVSEARLLSPIELQLTSKPERVAANKLYQSLGFQKKETNAYRMEV